MLNPLTKKNVLLQNIVRMVKQIENPLPTGKLMQFCVQDCFTGIENKIR